jgi:hypothetical protein
VAYLSRKSIKRPLSWAICAAVLIGSAGFSVNPQSEEMARARIF